jgi:hypothetical protein
MEGRVGSYDSDSDPLDELYNISSLFDLISLDLVAFFGAKIKKHDF